VRPVTDKRRASHWRWYQQVSAAERRIEDDLAMTKRLVAGFLWLLSGWCVGSAAALLLGTTPLLGPIIGVAAAVLVVGDPRRIIWTPREPVQVAMESAPDPA
jgi:hypothetical protein